MNSIFQARQHQFACSVLTNFLLALPDEDPARVHVQALMLDDNELHDCVTMLDTLFRLLAEEQHNALPSQ